MLSSQSEIRLINCSESEHASVILDILNEAIIHSTALYDYHLRPMDTMKSWFETKSKNDFPVIGAIDASGNLLGFASWGTFRAFPAYKYTVEHSVYIQKESRGRGLSKILMNELIKRARESQLHVLVGCIDASNEASISLHEKLGFHHVGTFDQIGFKFGRWLDVVFYQLNLDTPLNPIDG
ncbi:MAG: N-acetyltransferase [Gammaproteobacteria bacterium]|nr:N-acetyltransferase [Gammaproteobacteria bacterium]